MIRAKTLDWYIGYKKSEVDFVKERVPATVPGAVQLDWARAEGWREYTYGPIIRFPLPYSNTKRMRLILRGESNKDIYSEYVLLYRSKKHNDKNENHRTLNT